MLRILHLLGFFLFVFAGASALPALFALIQGDTASFGIFIQTALFYAFIGSLLVFGLTPETRHLGHAESCMLLVLIWLLGSLLSSLPYVLFLDAIPPTLALFEGVSGFTTTGASIFPRVEVLPDALVLWRSLTGWLGGLFFLMAALMVLGPLRIGGLPWGHRGMIELGGEDIVVRVFDLLETILPIYVGITAACFTATVFLTGGVPLFDALCLTLGAVSSTGFMPVDGDLSFYGSPMLEIILSLFMLLAATSIFWQRQTLKDPSKFFINQAETRWMIVAIPLIALYAAFQLLNGQAGALGLDVGGALREGFLIVSSVVSTTGYSVRDGYDQALSYPLLVGLTFIGGSVFSTSGGLKIYRFAALIIQSSRELQKLLYPHGVRASQIGQVFYDMQIMKAIWSAMVAYIAINATVACLVAHDLPDIEGTVLFAVSMVSNSGPIYPGSWMPAGTWPTFYELSMPSLWVGMGGMLLGRLEVIAVLSLLNLRLWRY